MDIKEYTPRQIVAELDKYVIGQKEAKKMVAIALRNRWRAKQLPEEVREEYVPKNIMLIGPTGVGKTELARRMAKLVKAPFLKVEATKFTEVGYVGRDVDQMIRDLTENAVRMVKEEWLESRKEKAEELANKRLLQILWPKKETKKDTHAMNPLNMLFADPSETAKEEEAKKAEAKARLEAEKKINEVKAKALAEKKAAEAAEKAAAEAPAEEAAAAPAEEAPATEAAAE